MRISRYLIKHNRYSNGAWLWLWILTVIFFTMFYGLMAQRSVSWQDSGMFQWRSLIRDYKGDYGLALAHPLYILLNGLVFRVFSERTALFLINALSGVGAAIAIANLTILGFLFVKSWWISFLISSMFAVSHAVWWLATIAEVYTWSIAGFTAELLVFYVFLRSPRWQTFTVLLFINGIGLTIHNFALLPLPIYLLTAIIQIIQKHLPKRALFVGIAAFFAGSSLYLAMIIDTARYNGIWQASKSALVGEFSSNVFNLTSSSSSLVANIGLTSLNLCTPLIPLTILGLVYAPTILGKAKTTALASIALVHFLFFIRYNVPDQFTFILPSLTMAAAFAVFGLSAVNNLKCCRTLVIVICVLSIPLTPVIYRVAPSVLYHVGFTLDRTRELPYRDEIRYWLVPWKFDETSAEDFAFAALSTVDQDSVVLADSTSVHPLLLYQKIWGVRIDVKILEQKNLLLKEEIDYLNFINTIGDRSLYVVSIAEGYVPERIRRSATFNQEGILYRVTFEAPEPSSLNATLPESLVAPHTTE